MLKKNLMLRDKVLGGLLGLCIGDALGVPVEGVNRAYLMKNPIQDMMGYGTYNLPPGTWSDDSSLALCLAQSLCETKNVNYHDIAEKFLKWLYEGYWTPFGTAFGIGHTTKTALERIKNGMDPLKAGLDDEYSNGNGSLMRILPLAYYLFGKNQEEQFETTHNVSRITHGHIRAQISCGIFIQFALNLLHGYSLNLSYENTRKTAYSYYSRPPYANEINHFERILIKKINEVPPEHINSDGYVVHTLESSLWCLLNTSSFKDAVLAAVNLGYDSDTTGAVTGALAGLHYGFKSIPEKWIKTLARAGEIIEVCEKLYETFLKNYCL